MADIVAPEKRSEMMAGIRGKDTKPELLVRKLLHAQGFRYRLHQRQLPGNPDLVFPRHNAVLFVHGCFWHRHDCHLFKWPETRTDFWRDKILGNVKRDARNRKSLIEEGWRTLVIWECALKGKTRLDQCEIAARAESWLLGEKREGEIAGA